MNKFSSIDAIERLVSDFFSRKLPFEDWSHEAHIVIGLWLVTNHDLDESIIQMRKGLILYNESAGIPNNRHNGYHETLTVFWLTTLDKFVRQHQNRSLVELVFLFCSSEQFRKDFPLKYYSRERLSSTEARALLIEPDTELNCVEVG